MSLDVDLYYTVNHKGDLKQADSYHRVWSWNITHNLNTLADALGCYLHLWHPGEIGENLEAKDLIPVLKSSLQELKNNIDKYKKFEPDNGWGTIDGFIEFLTNYIEACQQFPHASIRADR